MVVSLTQSTPYILKAIPLTKINQKRKISPKYHLNRINREDWKIEFLKLFSNWFSEWRDAGNLATKQTFDTLINSDRRIADLSSDLLNQDYKYILTGWLLTDPLERKFSQFRRTSGGRFLVCLNVVYRSESIIKLKAIFRKILNIPQSPLPSHMNN